MDPPVLHGETTLAALERWVGPRARWKLGRQALVTDAMVLWICSPPEVELIDAETVAWRAARRYKARRRGFDAFLPGPLRRRPPAELHLVGRTTNGALAYLGPAHLGGYGRRGASRTARHRSSCPSGFRASCGCASAASPTFA